MTKYISNDELIECIINFKTKRNTKNEIRLVNNVMRIINGLFATPSYRGYLHLKEDMIQTTMVHIFVGINNFVPKSELKLNSIITIKHADKNINGKKQ